MKSHTFILLFLILTILLSSCGVAVKEEAKRRDEARGQIMESISEQKLLDYVRKLSSDDYAGRLTGTPEYRACSRWVASLFEKWGLKPAGDDETYLQSYPNPYTRVFVGGELSYNYESEGRWRKKTYVYEKEYYPGSQSGDGELTAEVVYVGYGIMAPELNYNDYAGINVGGEIVLVEPEGPVSPDGNPDQFKDWRSYTIPDYKVKMAVAQGAKGMLYNELRVHPDMPYVPGFMVSHVGEAPVKDIFSRTGKNQEELKKEIDLALKPRSFRTHKRFTIKNFTKHYSKGTGYNVMGLIEGIDPLLKEDVIILGANLDHVGYCYEVMPGANANASGIAVMLGVAEAIARTPVRPKRSVLFIAFGSKEQGFKGSNTYFSNPLFKKDETVVFLNLDMVGCGNQLRAFGALNQPKIWKFFERISTSSIPQDVEPYPFDKTDRPRSDADIFLKKRIPSILFRAYGTPTYPYTTKDTVKTITPMIMKDLALILSLAILDLANADRNAFESSS